MIPNHTYQNHSKLSAAHCLVVITACRSKHVIEAPLACQLKCSKVKKRNTACTLTVEIRLKVVYLFSNDIPCWGTELSAFSPKSLRFNWHFEECFDSFRKNCTKQNSSHIFDNKWWLLKKEIFDSGLLKLSKCLK